MTPVARKVWQPVLALGNDLVGVALMQNAFKEGGPLSDSTAEKGEIVARMNLFAGAIGSYKNPPSHRAVTFDGPDEVARSSRWRTISYGSLMRAPSQREPHDSACPFHRARPRRIDPARSMRRFYRLDIEQDLFGGFLLMKQWSRIGTGGQIEGEWYDNEALAAAALAKQAARKQRWGNALGFTRKS